MLTYDVTNAARIIDYKEKYVESDVQCTAITPANGAKMKKIVASTVKQKKQNLGLHC